MKQEYLPLIYLFLGLSGAVALFSNTSVLFSLFPWPVWIVLTLFSLASGKNFWDFHSVPPIRFGPRGSLIGVNSIWLGLVSIVASLILLGRVVFWMLTSTSDLPHSSALVLGAALSLSAVNGLQQIVVKLKIVR